MNTHKKVSVLPIYLVGAVWLIYALLFPLYRPVHYLICAVLSLAAFAVGKALFASTLACVYEHDLFRTGEGGNGSPYAVAPGKPCPNRCVHECEGTFVRNGPFFEQVEAVFEGQVRCFKLATKTFPAPFPDPGMKVPPGKG